MTRDTHNLKTHPAPFQLVLEGRKPYEIRQADRPFKEGDLLHLQEWDPRAQDYTGRALTIPIATITPAGEWGLPANLCVLGLDVRLYVRERCAAELEAHAAKISSMTPPRCYTGPAISEVVASWSGAASFLREQAGAGFKLETFPSERTSAARDVLARVFYWLGLGDEGPESDLPTSEEISALSGGLYGLLEEVRVACVGLGGLLDMEGIARRALGPTINGAGPGCCDLYGTPHQECRNARDPRDGKMTDEDVTYCLRCAKECGAIESSRRLEAHIAVLTAEWDEADRQRIAANTAMQSIDNELRTLRERVKALEEDVADKRALAHKWKTATVGLHGQLAAIRQRAGDREALGRTTWEAIRRDNAHRPEYFPVWEDHREPMREEARRRGEYLVRWLLGPAAPPSEMDGLEGEMAAGCGSCPGCTDENWADGDLCDAPKHKSAEPTTDEAFATVRALVLGVPRNAQPSTTQGEQALSMLECRMGALEKENAALRARARDAEAREHDAHSDRQKAEALLRAEQERCAALETKLDNIRAWAAKLPRK